MTDENNNIILKNIPLLIIENLINGKGHYHEVYGFKSYIDRFFCTLIYSIYQIFQRIFIF